MKGSTGRDRLISAAIFFLAVILGFAVLSQFRQSPFARVLMSDEQSYTNWALSILSGRLLPSAPLYQDPLYPYLLALWFAIAGPDPQWVRVIQVLAGAAAVALAGAAGGRVLGRRGGIIAALLLAGCGSLYYFELQLSKETLVILLSALSLWLGARAGDGGTARPATSPGGNEWGRRFPGAGCWLALGLCCGLSCLTRGNFLLVAPGIALWALLRPGETRTRAAAQATIFSAGVVLLLLPVAASNYRASGEFALTTYSGGHNFYLGNNPDADGGYVIPAFAHGDPLQDPADFRAEAERRAGQPLTDTQAARYWRATGLDWLRENPADAARLYARKIFLLLQQREPPNLYSLDFLRRNFVSLLWLPALGYGWLWGPALIGALALRRRPAAQYLIAFTLLYSLSLLPFFIVDRYRAPLLPALATLAVGGIMWLARAFRDGQRTKPAVAAVVVVALGVIGHWPRASSDSVRAQERALVGYAYLHDGDPAAALRWYNEARALAPGDENIWTGWAESVSALDRDQLPLLLDQARTDDPVDLFFVGKRLSQLGRYPEAVRAFEEVVRLDPRCLRACLHLAHLYSRPEMRDPAKATEWVMRALAIDPINTEAFDTLDRVASISNAPEK